MIPCRSGSVLALGLLNNDWNLEECTQRFLKVVNQCYSPRNRRKFSRIGNQTYRYGATALDASMREHFTEEQPLFGGTNMEGRLGSGTKVIIPTTNSAGKIKIFANYRSGTEGQSEYLSSSYFFIVLKLTYLYFSSL